MSVTLVQSTATSGYSVGPFTIAFPSNNAAGNALVLTIWSNGTVSSVTDSQGNTWTLLGPSQVSNSGGSLNYAYGCMSCAAGPNTVTVHQSSGDAGAVTALVEVAITGGVILDRYAHSHSTVATSPSITPTAADSFVLCHWMPDGSSPSTANSPFTTVNTNPSYGIAGYDILSAAAATNCSFSGGSNAGFIIFDLISASAPPPPAPTSSIFFIVT
jgi:hypothetical protein